MKSKKRPSAAAISKRSIGEPFLYITNAVFDDPKFQSLSHVAVCLLLALLRKYKPHLNGNIPLGVREAAAIWHCGQATACRALKELETGGFITCMYKGHLVATIGRPDAPSRWRVNFMKGSGNEQSS
jgi:hypothetical protein